jgi:hypothetical protein
MAQLCLSWGSLEAIKVLQSPTDHILHAGIVKHVRELHPLVQVYQADPVNTPLQKVKEEVLK